MAFCPEHRKWDQNVQFTPLSETTSIPTPFICGVPPPREFDQLCSITEPIEQQSDRLGSIEFDWYIVRFRSIDYAGLNSYHRWCQQQNFGIIWLTYFFPIRARFFLYYMYSTCSLLEHEVILAWGSGTRICLLEDLFFLILFLIMSLTDHNFLSLRMSSKQGRTCSRVHDISARHVPLGIKTVWNLDTTNPSVTNNTWIWPLFFFCPSYNKIHCNAVI